MTDRQLIADLLSALEYHTEQTRPIEVSRVAIEAAREYLRKPAQHTWVGLTDEDIEKGRDQTFSINNPYCPCDSKTMRKAVRWAEAKLRERNATAQRKPLTDEEIKDAVRGAGLSFTSPDFKVARAIEAKLREKNA